MAAGEVMDMQLHEKELRLVYGETLVELGGQDERIVALDADLMNASGTTPFREAFPERHFDVGVAEANMMGIAAGLSTVGKVPFCPVNAAAVSVVSRIHEIQSPPSTR